VLAERLKEEVEEKKLIPGNQARFRRGMGTMDQIYALNYLINRQIGRDKGKMIGMFIDLKAAFDSVDKEVLIKAMRGRGMREGLINRVEEVLRETRSRVRVGTQCGGVFWTARGVRQGCPLSPILFNDGFVDSRYEGMHEKRRMGRSEIENREDIYVDIRR